MNDVQMMNRALSYYQRTGKDNFRHNKFALLTRKGGSWSGEEVMAICAMHSMVSQVKSQPEYLVITGGIGKDSLEYVLNKKDFDFFETSDPKDPKLPFRPC